MEAITCSFWINGSSALSGVEEESGFVVAMMVAALRKVSKEIEGAFNALISSVVVGESP